MGNTTPNSPSFVTFWLGKGLDDYMEVLKNFFIFVFNFFSIPYLLKTLFSPWKRSYRVKERPGFSFEVMWEIITFNLVSRTIGAILRISTILIGILCLGLLLIASVVYILIWFFIIPLPMMAYGKYRDRHDIRFLQTASTDRDIWKNLLGSPYGKFLIQRLELTGSPNLSSTERTLTLAGNSIPELLVMWFDSNQEVVNFFDSFHIRKQDLLVLQRWWEMLLNEPGIFSKESLLRIPSIGKTWTYGYTPTLDRFTVDLSSLPIPYGHVNGRTKELKAMEEILMKREARNAFLVGEPGVGKHPLLIYLAHQIASGHVYPDLEAKRLVSLEMEQLFEEESDVTSRKSTVAQILNEAGRAGNIILIIEDFDRYVSTGKDRDDMSDVFLHALSRGTISIIAAVSPEDFHQYIRPHAQLTKFFESVHINPTSPEETLEILINILPVFERHHITFTYQALAEVIKLGEMYIPDKVFPEKAITIMEDVETYVRNTPQLHFITPSFVQEVFEKKEGIPVHVSNTEADKLLKVEAILHSRVIGQDSAIAAVSTALKRSRTNVTTKHNRPMGSFLFLGPTGVGKTETAKALADLFFGGENRLLRVDMNEYTTPQSVNEILGDPHTGNVGTFFPRVRELKYGVVLLDEFEKADPQVKQLFLSLLDEGYLTDAFGKTVSFLTTIVIATSNAGTEYIREHIHNNDALSEQAVLEYLQTKGIFSPELLNRFDSVVVFTPLSPDQIETIMTMTLVKLAAQVKDQYGISLKINPQTKVKLLHDGFSSEFGGRALYRAVQRIIENPLSEKALRGELKRGEIVEI